MQKPLRRRKLLEEDETLAIQQVIAQNREQWAESRKTEVLLNVTNHHAHQLKNHNQHHLSSLACAVGKK
jgi:hypothetical protein